MISLYFLVPYNLQAMVPVKAPNWNSYQELPLMAARFHIPLKQSKEFSMHSLMLPNGSYVATYFQDVTPPVISNIVATPNPNGTVTITWTTNEPSTSIVDYGIVSTNLNQNFTDNNNLVTSHSVLLTGLNPGTTYYFRVSSVDLENNLQHFTCSTGCTMSFLTASALCVSDNTDFDFAGGATGANTRVVIDGNGALILTPFLNEEFSISNLRDGHLHHGQPGVLSIFLGGIALLEYGHLYTIHKLLHQDLPLSSWQDFPMDNSRILDLSSDGNFNASMVNHWPRQPLILEIIVSM